MGNTKVVSEDGREIKIHFRSDYIAYIESKHAVYIGMVHSYSESGVVHIRIDAADCFSSWLPPYSNGRLTNEKKIEILNFLTEAFKLLGYDYEIIAAPDK